MKILTCTFLCAMLLAMAACTSSRITSSWKAPGSETHSIQKIMVLGLINEPDRQVRETMEQDLVAELKALGYDAVCSCEQFAPRSFENLSEREAVSRLKEVGVDAVLSIVLLDKTKERYYVPGRVYFTPYVVYHRRFWGYYTTLYDRVYAPGYYQTNTRYFWESNLYTLADGNELLYSVQTQSFDPASTESLAREYSQLIVRDMVKNAVLRKP